MRCFASTLLFFSVLFVVLCDASSSLCPRRPRPPRRGFQFPANFTSQLEAFLGSYLAPCSNSSIGPTAPSATAVSAVFVLGTNGDESSNNTVFINLGCASKTSPGVPPTPSSIYPIASVTKTYTSLMAFQLAMDGKIDSLDDPLSKYYPAFGIRNPWATKPDDVMRGPSIRSILSQQGGIPRAEPCYPQPCPEVPNDVLFNRTRELKMIFREYEKPSYSNLGFDVVGHALARGVLNMSYEDAIEAIVTKPIGIAASTGFNWTSAQVRARMVSNYVAGGQKATPGSLGFGNPAGGIYTTTEDAAKYLRHLSRLWRDEPQIKQMMQPAYLYGDFEFAFGAPWETQMRKPYLVRGKGGGLPGVTTGIAVVPEAEFGMAIFWNGEMLPGQTTLINKVVDLLSFDALRSDYERADRDEFPPLPAGFNVSTFLGSYAGGSNLTLAGAKSGSPTFPKTVLFLITPLGNYVLRPAANSSSSASSRNDGTRFAFQFSDEGPEMGTCFGMAFLGMEHEWVYLGVDGSGTPFLEMPSMVYGVRLPWLGP